MAFCFGPGVMGRVSREDELVPYSDDADGDCWDLADMLVDSHTDLCVIPRQGFDAICELCCYASVAVPDDANGFLSWAF